MSIESTRAIMERYFGPEHSMDVLAQDVVFTNMGTGEEHNGPEEVSQMMTYIYSVAFDAKAEMKNLVYGENNASAEFDMVGKHIGEFAGIPATGKSFSIRGASITRLRRGKIVRNTDYWNLISMLKQLGQERE